MKHLAKWGALLAAAAALSGCVVTSPMPSLMSPKPETPNPPPPELAIGGRLGAELGAQLDPADRQAAYAAELDAVGDGQRHPWRGPHEAFGFVDPGPNLYRTEGMCRQYTQTIYIGGRVHTGTGLACHQSDGQWHIVS